MKADQPVTIANHIIRRTIIVGFSQRPQDRSSHKLLAQLTVSGMDSISWSGP